MARLTCLLASVLFCFSAIGGCASNETSASAKASANSGRGNVALGASGMRQTDRHENDDDDVSEEIPLSDVPQHVKDAAIAAVPGLVLEEAEREHENGALVYEVEGKADGIEYEVEVNEDGTVLEIETDDDEDDEDDDDDD